MDHGQCLGNGGSPQKRSVVSQKRKCKAKRLNKNSE